ncbi:MAG TPA: M13 family metallopeptidase [Longimicrobiaceae bacterium]|nr:M13 family metallopeptidase [Longimicrobiaceae bacterium]
MRTSRLAALAGGAVLTVLAAAPAVAQEPASGSTALPALQVIDPAYIDTSADACGDFFEYANGAWLKSDTIPAAYASSGVARDMSDRNELVVRQVLQEAMQSRKSLPLGSTERKLGTYYASCMDSTAAEQAGVEPVLPVLARIDSISSRDELLRAIGTLQRNGTGAAFRYGAEVDPHDASHYLASFSQGGLGLPDRDYYTKTDSASQALRDAYVQHVARLLTLAGEPDDSARADASRVMALETELAKASLTRVQRRDPAATDHPMSTAELRTLTPDVDWNAYFAAIGLATPVQRVNVGEPDFFRTLNQLIASTPLNDWRAYLRYHALEEASPWLSSPFVEENFAFRSRFTGAKEMLPRWKRCLGVTDGTIGEALGEAYVAKTFSPEAKARAKSVIDDIRASFGERLKELDWMSDTTRAQALDKLARMSEKVGYPQEWRDYTKLQVTEGPFVQNLERANAFEWNRVVNRPGEPVDTTEWGMTVPTVNAYYDPSKNEMVFPAGALAPQTFDPEADDAANYGSLGASWAGHELTHGFDDQGRHYDAEGNLRDWWTDEDAARFEAQAQKVVEQFSGYISVDTLHLNGKLTLGENIADYGGLLTAYDALERALKRNGRPGLIDGYTPEQRFFLAYAQSWRNHIRPEAARSRVLTDPHAPARWRVNGPLSNISAFAKAFGCKPGDAMVRPAELVPHIW